MLHKDVVLFVTGIRNVDNTSIATEVAFWAHSLCQTIKPLMRKKREIHKGFTQTVQHYTDHIYNRNYPVHYLSLPPWQLSLSVSKNTQILFTISENVELYELYEHSCRNSFKFEENLLSPVHFPSLTQRGKPPSAKHRMATPSQQSVWKVTRFAQFFCRSNPNIQMLLISVFIF